MQKVVVVDADTQDLHVLKCLERSDSYQISGIIDQTSHFAGRQFANQHGIPHGPDPSKLITENVQWILDFSHTDSIVNQEDYPNLKIINQPISQWITTIVTETCKELHAIFSDITTYKSIFNSVDEGMIGIDETGIVTLFNDSASKMLGLSIEDVIGEPILNIIPNTGLLTVLTTGQSVVDDELQASNGLNIVSSRYPIVMPNGTVSGAFAVFKDVTGVLRTAEEITDLKRVKTMLEEIIY